MTQMIDCHDVAALLEPPGLVDVLAEAFREGCVMPARHHHTLRVPGAPDATLLLMPCWTEGGVMGVKAASIFPGNAARGLEAVSAIYLLFDATTGAPLAIIDGGELTARRTAAASALAARYLARSDVMTHLIVGTGRLSRHLARAHRETRPSLVRTLIWGRDPAKAVAVARDLADSGIAAEPAGALAEAVGAADIVSCATLATAPLIQGAWLRAGQHIDLVGGFTPAMREADDETVRRARVFVDTLGGATESGDIAAPLAAGIIQREDLRDLFALVRGTAEGRRYPGEITLFKSVGAAIEDLAAARLVLDRLRTRRTDP
jgi:ornithine cyclodeaminase